MRLLLAPAATHSLLDDSKQYAHLYEMDGVRVVVAFLFTLLLVGCCIAPGREVEGRSVETRLSVILPVSALRSSSIS